MDNLSFIGDVTVNTAIRFCGLSGLPTCIDPRTGRARKVFKRARLVVGVVSVSGEPVHCVGSQQFKIVRGTNVTVP